MHKKITLIIVITAILFSSYKPVEVKAGPYNEEQKKVLAITSMLRKVIESDYKKTIESIKMDIRNNDFDYELSMESISNSGNPYKKIDYIDFLSTYIASKKIAKEERKEIPLISEIPFISFSLNSLESEQDAFVEYDTFHEVVLKDGAEKLFEENKYYEKGGKAYTRDEIEIDNYVPYKNTQFFVKSGTKTIKPVTEIIKYAEIEFNTISREEILNILGVNQEEIKEEYEKCKDILTKYVNNEEIKASTLISVPGNLLNDIDINLEDITDPLRINIVKTAASLISQVPYQWGGKPQKAGYDTSWWSFDSNSEQKGLDCSGFVEWTFLTAGFPEALRKHLHSTNAILKAGFYEIPKSNLKPGDIGLLNSGEKTNHTGIYLGNNKWIHCSSAANTVTISEFKFTRFYSVIDSSIFDLKDEDLISYAEKEAADIYISDKEKLVLNYEEEEENEEDVEEKAPTIANIVPVPEVNTEIIPIMQQVQTPIAGRFTEEDIYLAAQLIYHEAFSEGVNGWIAVGEVLLNRINSDLFPNSVAEVVYQKGQFTNSKALSSITPTSELLSITRAVLSGEMKILNNDGVYFFRNPMITSSIPASEAVNWGSHPYYCGIGHHAFYLR